MHLRGPGSVGSEHLVFLFPKGRGSEGRGNTGYKTAAALLEGPGRDACRGGTLLASAARGPALTPGLPWAPVLLNEALGSFASCCLPPVSLAVESATFPSERRLTEKHETTNHTPELAAGEDTPPTHPRTLVPQKTVTAGWLQAGPRGPPGLPPSQAPMQRPQLWGHSHVPTPHCGTL